MSNTQPEEEVPPEALQPEACDSEFSTKVKTVPEVVGRKKNSVVTQEGMGRNKEGRKGCATARRIERPFGAFASC
jgi:hypothetical protein